MISPAPATVGSPEAADRLFAALDDHNADVLALNGVDLTDIETATATAVRGALTNHAPGSDA